MSLSSTPPAQVYDPNTVAQQQTNANLGAQASSNVNQDTPYGSVSYSQTGTSAYGTPIYTAKTQLSPQQQAILDSVQGAQKTAAGQAGNLITNANYGSTNPATDVGNMTSGNTQAILAKETSYLDPFFTQQQQQQDTQLQNQGLTPGSPAYQQAMNNLRQSQNQSVSGFLAQAEPAAYSQAVTSETLPLTLASAELGISPVQNPNSSAAPSVPVQPANVTGAYSTAQNALEQQQAQATANQDAMMSGMFGIGSAVAGGLARNPTATAGIGNAASSAASGIGSWLSSLLPAAAVVA